MMHSSDLSAVLVVGLQSSVVLDCVKGNISRVSIIGFRHMFSKTHLFGL